MSTHPDGTDEIDVADVIEKKYKLSLGLIFAIVITILTTTWGVFWFFDNIQDSIKSISDKVNLVEKSVSENEKKRSENIAKIEMQVKSLKADITAIQNHPKLK